MSSWIRRLAGREPAPLLEPPAPAAEPAPPVPAPGAPADDLREEIRDLAETFRSLGQDVERAGKQQARSALTLDTIQRNLGELREQVRAADARALSPAEQVSEVAAALRAEIESATAASLLPVLDSLDESERLARALAHTAEHAGGVSLRDLVRGAAEVALLGVGGPASAQTPGALRQWADGVALTRRRMEDALARLGATPISALQEPFDPHLHRAVEVRATHAEPAGTVVEVLRRGFLIHGRVLRYADVVVAKRPEEDE